MFAKQDIPAETSKKILSMQKDIRHFLEVTFKGEDRTPFNSHRIGIYIEDEEVAIDVGYSNYRELVALHTYIKMNHQSEYEHTTYIDLIAAKGEKAWPNKFSEDAYKVELSIITWLGSNVGQGFLQKFKENLDK